jgi:NADH-quinone oxidoreductase subunit L
VFGLTAMLAAGLTAFYMSRLFLLTFHGKRRWTDDVHPHESPLLMTLPMMVLAIGSAFLGLALGPTGAIQSWLTPVVGEHPEVEPVLPAVAITVLTLVLVALGVGLAYVRYVRESVPVLAPAGALVTRAARRDLFQDDVNEALLMRPGQHLTRSLVYVDNEGVDGGVRGLAALIGGTSGRVRRLQTGFVRSYALTMLGGVVVAIAALAVAR